MLRKTMRKRSFIYLLILMSIAIFYLMRPYLNLAALALMLVILFDPVYKSVLRRTKRKGIAVFFTVTLVMMCIIIPFFVVLSVATDQALAVSSMIQDFIAEGGLDEREIMLGFDRLVRRLPFAVDPRDIIDVVKIDEQIANIGTMLTNFVTNTLIDFVTNGIAIIGNVTILAFMLVYLFPDKDKFFYWLTKISPLEDEDDRLFLKRFESMTKSILKGNLFIALVQGTLGGVAFWLVGIPSPVFWAMLMMIAALIPLGAGIIYIPVSIVLMFTGGFTKGLFLFLFGNLIISTIDNIIRGKLLQGEASMHPMLTLISVLGGVRLFGMFGVIFGPVMMALFMTAMHVYEVRVVDEYEDADEE